MSWRFLRSALECIRPPVRASPAPSEWNPETPASVLLSATCLESFANEVSSLTAAFFFDRRVAAYLSAADRASGLPDGFVEGAVARIRDDPGTGVDARFRDLLDAVGGKRPAVLKELALLGELRDALVHQRACDIPAVDREHETIRFFQNPPPAFRRLRLVTFHGRPLLGKDIPNDESSWTVRVSTGAVGLWALESTVVAITHLLDGLPGGAYREAVVGAYRPPGVASETVFHELEGELAALRPHVLT